MTPSINSAHPSPVSNASALGKLGLHFLLPYFSYLKDITPHFQARSTTEPCFLDVFGHWVRTHPRTRQATRCHPHACLARTHSKPGGKILRGVFSVIRQAPGVPRKAIEMIRQWDRKERGSEKNKLEVHLGSSDKTWKVCTPLGGFTLQHRSLSQASVPCSPRRVTTPKNPGHHSVSPNQNRVNPLRRPVCQHTP